MNVTLLFALKDGSEVHVDILADSEVQFQYADTQVNGLYFSISGLHYNSRVKELWHEKLKGIAVEEVVSVTVKYDDVTIIDNNPVANL
jgi:hypothetical protein